LPHAPLSELLITLFVAGVYLTLVRLVDVNEREPVWAIGVVFLFGATGAGLADLLVGSGTLTISVWGGALAVEAAKLLSLGAAILVFKGVARIRGWSEFSDLVDGLVYGIIVGLGYSTGETLLRELHTARFVSLHLMQTPLQTAIQAAASGLSHGVFGAVVGLGFGAALEARRRTTRRLAPLIALGLATLLDGLFRVLAHGNGLGGSAGLHRAWLAVLIPLAVFIVIGVVALTVERRVIREELASEFDSGSVRPEDLELLGGLWRRQFRYLALLLRGRVAACLRLAALHNRQVQLALLKRRIRRESDAGPRQRLERQADLVRGALRHARVVGLLALMVLAIPPGRAAEPGGIQFVPQRITLDSMIGAARRDIDAYWARQLGSTYRPPAGVGPFSLLSMNCPPEQRNARYCASDRRIYYDGAWLESFRAEAGDFAPVFVIAHEWGHLVQDLRGDLSPQVGLWTIQIELQADCLAGEWTRDANRRGFVQSGADDQALTALRRLRDPVDFPWFNTHAHGSAGQRIDAYLEGDDGRPCTGADFWKRVHADPQASEQAATPSTGSLIDGIACRMGRFTRTDVHAWPDALSSIVADAIQATFQSADGVMVSEFVLALVNAPAAQSRFESFVTNSLSKGYRVTQQGSMMDGATQVGEWKLLDGLDEIVVLRNRQRVMVYEGPVGPAWEFGKSNPVFECK